jgi:serine protease
MYKPSRLAAIFGCAATLAMVGCAANSGVTPFGGTTTQQSQSHVVPFSGPGWIQKDGVLYHVPHYMVTRSAAQSQVQPMIKLNYYGGPVLVKPKAYIVYWGFTTYGDPNGVKPLLTTYSKAMGGSAHNKIYDQYYMKMGTQTIYITDPRRQLGAVWEDDTNPVPNSPSDSQIAAEALKLVAQVGYDPNGSYIVQTPHNHNSQGFGSSFCAYHSATTYNGKLVAYTNLPYMPDAGGNCGASIISPPSDESAADEGVTIVEGHEYGESVTDPNPPSGWYNPSAGEIGDICAWQNIQNDPFHRHSYTMQPMFSNATQSCVHS